MRHRTTRIADYNREVQRGRGRGSGAQYRPWLTTSDVTHSNGMRCRLYLQKFGRIMHVLSRAELLTLLQLDWNPAVVEVYEQYPLDPNDTLRLAKELELHHPGYSFGGTVMTTDFFCRRRIGLKFQDLAFQVKSSRRDTESARTKEKLLIEQEYWKQRKVSWKVIYASDFNPIECSNLERLAKWRNMSSVESDLKELEGCFFDMRSACPQAGKADLCGVDLTLPSGRMLNAWEGMLLLTAKQRVYFPVQKKPLEDGLLEDYRSHHAQ